jgi:hypothetical protein
MIVLGYFNEWVLLMSLFNLSRSKKKEVSSNDLEMHISRAGPQRPVYEFISERMGIKAASQVGKHIKN